MKRIFASALLLIPLSLCLFAQESAEQGFFEDGSSSLEVKTFSLPVDDRGETVNCYVAWQPGSGQAVVIDPGTPGPGIAEFVRARSLKVLAILNTHGHLDHCGGDGRLAAELSVPVYVHGADRKRVSSIAGGNCPVINYPEERPLVLDGWEIEVIPTPGHTPGSVCLRFGETLFSGDTLFAGVIGKADGKSKRARSANLRREIRMIHERLLLLPPATRVFPGHGPATTIGAEKAFNPYLIR